MTVDVEEHFQVSGFADSVSRGQWESLPSRVAANTEHLLDLFDECGVRATFFVLGWIANRHPDLVRRAAARGHEVACHGHSHRLIYDQTPERFREETVASRKLLQDLSGQHVVGYRAASFSIVRGTLWALDVVAEAGFLYDSSIFPVVHDRYGIPGFPRLPHRLKTPAGHSLVEVPPSTLHFGWATIPVGGGGYLRLYPGVISHWAVRRLNRRDRAPAVVYVHPWELDPQQPRMEGPALSRFRHYYGLRTTRRKLRRLMRSFRFGTMRRVIEESGLTEVPQTDVRLVCGQ